MGDGGLSIIGRGDQENVEKEGKFLDRIYRMGRIGGRVPPVLIVPPVPLVPFGKMQAWRDALPKVFPSPLGGNPNIFLTALLFRFRSPPIGTTCHGCLTTGYAFPYFSARGKGWKRRLGYGIMEEC